MHADHIQVGDKVKNSPIGAGTVTGFTSDGFVLLESVGGGVPQGVGWVERDDGKKYGPFGTLSRAATPTATTPKVSPETPVPAKSGQPFAEPANTTPQSAQAARAARVGAAAAAAFVAPVAAPSVATPAPAPFAAPVAPASPAVAAPVAAPVPVAPAAVPAESSRLPPRAFEG